MRSWPPQSSDSPSQDTGKLPSFWLQTWTLSQAGPRGRGSRSSSHNVKHSNDLRNLIFTSSTQNRHGAMYKLGRTDRDTHGHGLARTHLLVDGGAGGGTCPPDWEPMPTHFICVSSIRPLHRIFIEPVQKHLWGGGGRQARPGSQEDAGVGLGLETWQKRDWSPLLICRARPPFSWSLDHWVTGQLADCPSVSPFLPLQARGRRVLGGLGLGG